MTTVTLKEALVRLAELVALLNSGETVVITDGDHEVAKLVPPDKRVPEARGLRGMGSMRGTVLYMAEDFDEPLEEFKEYM